MRNRKEGKWHSCGGIACAKALGWEGHDLVKGVKEGRSYESLRSGKEDLGTQVQWEGGALGPQTMTT